MIFNSYFISFVAINEPPLPRRKKCPELAYKHHEFMSHPTNGHDQVDSVTRAARVSDNHFFLFEFYNWCFVLLFLNVVRTFLFRLNIKINPIKI